MKSTFRLGAIFGIPIGLNLSWFISLGFVMIALGARVYPDLFPGLATWAHWVLATVSACLFFASIILHELAHGLVARRYGIPVKEITLFVLGGVARIAREAPRPFAEFVMAAAGPMTSLALAAFFVVLWLLSGRGDGPLPTMWQWLWIMNLVLALFNLIPGLPLDGGRLLRAAIWGATSNYNRATRLSTLGGHLTAYLLMMLGTIVILGPDGIVFGLSPLNGLWFVVLGMFLKASAHQSYFQLRALNVLRDYNVANMMSWNMNVVAPEMTVEEAMRRYHRSRDYLFVQRDGAVVGVIEGRRLRSVPKRSRARTTLGQVMTSANIVSVARPDDNMADVLQLLELNDAHDLPVVKEGRVIGYVGRDSFLPIFAQHPELSR